VPLAVAKSAEPGKEAPPVTPKGLARYELKSPVRGLTSPEKPKAVGTDAASDGVAASAAAPVAAAPPRLSAAAVVPPPTKLRRKQSASKSGGTKTEANINGRIFEGGLDGRIVERIQPAETDIRKPLG
jgi:hypothetical protein